MSELEDGPEGLAGLAHCLTCGQGMWDPVDEDSCWLCGTSYWALLPDDPALVPAGLASIKQQLWERYDKLESEGWLHLEVTFDINVDDECRPKPA